MEVKVSICNIIKELGRWSATTRGNKCKSLSFPFFSLGSRRLVYWGGIHLFNEVALDSNQSGKRKIRNGFLNYLLPTKVSRILLLASQKDLLWFKATIEFWCRNTAGLFLKRNCVIKSKESTQISRLRTTAKALALGSPWISLFFAIIETSDMQINWGRGDGSGKTKTRPTRSLGVSCYDICQHLY